MATPIDTGYTRADGTDIIYAGLPGVPFWRSSMTALTWAELTPANTIQSLDPENSLATNPNFPGVSDYRANQGINAKLKSWNGGIWMENLLEFRTGPSGGHNDLWSNADFVWDAITTDWVRASDPTDNSTDLGDLTTSGMLYADGRVRSCHTYGLFAERNSVAWFFGGAIARTTGTFFSQPFFWNGTDWERDADVILHSNISTGCRSAVYNPTTDKFWIFQGANQVPRIYDPVLKTVTNATRFLNMSDDKLAFYLGDPDIYLVFGQQASVNAVRVLTLDSDATDINSVGTAPTISDYGAMGICHDTIRDRYLIYDGGATVYTLTPPVDNDYVNSNWTWGQLTLDGSNVVIPTAAQPNGTFERFWFSESLNCCGVTNEIDEAMYVLALENV